MRAADHDGLGIGVLENVLGAAVPAFIVTALVSIRSGVAGCVGNVSMLRPSPW